MSYQPQLLREQRKRLGKKLREVAAETGVDASLLSRIERGERKPTVSQLAALSQAYDLEEHTLRRWLKVREVIYILDQDPDLAVSVVEDIRAEYLRSPEGLDPPEIESELQHKLDRVDALKQAWKNKKPLGPAQLARMRELFHTEYTYESNKIEGNTLSLQETSLVINEGLTISGKTMKEHLEAINHAEAIAFIEDLARSRAMFSPPQLAQLHRLVLGNIDREHAGKYRQVPVRITGSEHIPPEPFLLQKMMEDYFLFYTREKHRIHPLILAADMHERLVTIHPFIDGNGRTARLVMNLILLQHGYTLTSLKGDPESRMAYFKALQQVQVRNTPATFYHLVADAVAASLQAHLALA